MIDFEPMDFEECLMAGDLSFMDYDAIGANKQLKKVLQQIDKEDDDAIEHV